VIEHVPELAAHALGLGAHGSHTQRARPGESDHDGLGEPVSLATVGTGSTGAIEILVCCETTRRNEVVVIDGHRYVICVLTFDVS
jgi:hypothetical protein